MSRHFIVFLAAFLVCGLAYSLVRHPNLGASSRPVAELSRDQSNIDEDKAREASAEERAKEAYISKLAHMANVRDRLSTAEARTTSERRFLQLRGQAAWTALISAKREGFNKLRQQAVRSGKDVPCTLCDGHGRLSYCPLCDHSGKCLTCNGTGRRLGGELCGACLGDGECFLCNGMGRLACPFCDDGTISLKLPLPPAKMPVE